MSWPGCRPKSRRHLWTCWSGSQLFRACASTSNIWPTPSTVSRLKTALFFFLALTVVDDLRFSFLDTELEPPCASDVYVGRQVVEKIGLVFHLDEGGFQTSQQTAHWFEVWTMGFNLAIPAKFQLSISG